MIIVKKWGPPSQFIDQPIICLQIIIKLIMSYLFDECSMVYLTPIIPIIQIEKTKCDYPDHILQSI